MNRVDLRRTDGDEILFGHEELMDSETKEVRLAPGFGPALVILRMTFAKPMIVNSCCRTAGRNRAIGGHPRSLHVYDAPYHDTSGAAAIDIRLPSGNYGGHLAYLAWEQGWSYGIGHGFIHLDRRVDWGMPQAVFPY